MKPHDRARNRRAGVSGLAGVIDIRKGINRLSALAQNVLRQKPTGGAVFAFRGRRGGSLPGGRLLAIDERKIARLKEPCRRCEKITQLPAPSRPIPRSMFGPGLLARILVTKFDDHLALYRLNEIFARMGPTFPVPPSWIGAARACGFWILHGAPAASRKAARKAGSGLMRAMTDHGVAPCARGAQSNNLSICAGRVPPGAVYYFSTDRKGEHPQSHLAEFEGILQADAFSGFNKLYEPDATGTTGTVRVHEAACWAHLRRDFHDVWATTKSEIAREALDRIGALYDIEREITGPSAEQRKAARQKLSKPKVKAFKLWTEAQFGRIPGKGDLAKAFRYGLRRWPSFTLFLDNGRVAIDNNAAERAIKPVVIGTENFMFAGSDAADETLADAMSIIETAKFSGLNPKAYLAEVFARFQDHKINRINKLLPWNWKPKNIQETVAT